MINCIMLPKKNLCDTEFEDHYSESDLQLDSEITS